MSLSKLFQRIIWHNNTTPAINEDNLNAMSKAIDDIDDRVILIGDDVVTVIPQIQAYLEQAESIVEAVEELSQNPPYIGANGNWYVFDTTLEAYKDSGVDASITVDIADITMIAEGAQPYVTNTGTSTDPIFHLFLPRSPQGATGNGIANIAKTSTQGLVDTYTITMTDGTTYTFTVTNGQGIGDMTKAVYDSTNTVANAGGIADYVEGKVAPMLNVLGAKNLLKYSLTSGTYHEVVYTVNSDKTISVTTTEATASARFISLQADLSNLIHGETYILNGCPSGGSVGTTYVLYITDGTDDFVDTGNGIQFVYDSTKTYILRIVLYTGVNLTTLVVFEPMIRPASIQDDTYVPYSMTNQQLTPYALSQSNPNLLDNPWFTINQRGQNSYGNSDLYSVDRWKRINELTVDVNNGYIAISNTDWGLLQKLENAPEVGVYTASIIARKLVMPTGGGMMFGGRWLTAEEMSVISGNDWGLLSITYDPSYWSGLNKDEFRIDFNGNLGSTYGIEIKAVKFELGSVSTLANDTPPNYGLELLKCQTSTASSSDAYANRNISGAELMLEQSQTLSTSADTVYTFTNGAITTSSAIEVYTDIYGINPSNVVATSGQCVVTFPKQSTAQTMTCRMYIK